MKASDKTPEGLRRLAAESRQAAEAAAPGEDRTRHESIAAELDRMAEEQ